MTTNRFGQHPELAASGASSYHQEEHIAFANQSAYRGDGTDKFSNLDQSSRLVGGRGDQGEIRIKYTDSAKALPSENAIPFYRDPGPNKSDTIEIKVNFAMAYGNTQNFSQPIYSGIFAYKCTFNGKRLIVSNSYFLSVLITNYNNYYIFVQGPDNVLKQQQEEVQLTIMKHNCAIDQNMRNGRNDKVVQNLEIIIEKAIKLQIRKINLR